MLFSELLVLDCSWAELVEYVDQNELAQDGCYQTELVHPEQSFWLHVIGVSEDVNNRFDVVGDEAD